MKKFLILLLFIILPVFAYEVYSPENYKYSKEGDTLLFVLDYSNSMSEYINGKTKVNHLKEVVRRVLPEISSETKMGLRVYGHTCNLLAYNACRSSELVVPIGENHASNISEGLNRLRPRGMTPITYSLKQSVNRDLRNFYGNKHIILLTDGGENCDESPCEYAIELVKKRRDIKIDVIAFDVKDDDDLAQLKCTADVTGGNFIETNTVAQLTHAMQDLVIPHKTVQAQIYTGMD